MRGIEFVSWGSRGDNTLMKNFEIQVINVGIKNKTHIKKTIMIEANKNVELVIGNFTGCWLDSQYYEENLDNNVILPVFLNKDKVFRFDIICKNNQYESFRIRDKDTNMKYIVIIEEKNIRVDELT